MPRVVEARGIVKSYGRLRVLQGLDVTVQRAQVTAIIGPNASGKTTFNKILLGLVRPDGGEITIDGARINGASAYRANIGYMPQAARFPENLCADDVFRMLADIRGVSADSARGGANGPASGPASGRASGLTNGPARGSTSGSASGLTSGLAGSSISRRSSERDEELIETLSLGPVLKTPIRILSGGMRQRVNAALAFLFRPSLLLLDEPTAGLDPISSSTLKDKILRERAAGRTFILTSHVLSELEELADRITFLLDGVAHFSGTQDELKHQTNQPTLERAIAQLMRQRASLPSPEGAP
ncbi:MAG: ABC transporter ATP-binding protein [Gemmatimonadaceae bacterium]|nr:ABC transporter ATP-binding protein [Gemmatimonadaceae bacterium]